MSLYLKLRAVFILLYSLLIARTWRNGIIGFLALFLVACGPDSLNEARELHGEGDMEALELALEKYDEVLYHALAAVEGKYDVQVLMAIKFAEAENYNACIDRLQSAYKIKSTDANLYYYLGLCYTHLARTTSEKDKLQMFISQAKQAFEQGLTYDNKNPLLYYGQGILLGFVMDQTEDAILQLEQSYALEPYDLNVLFALGNLYYRANKVERSKRFYREVMDKTPKDSPRWKKAQQNLAQIKRQS